MVQLLRLVAVIVKYSMWFYARSRAVYSTVLQYPWRKLYMYSRYRWNPRVTVISFETGTCPISTPA